MSAQVIIETIYSAYCPDCNVGYDTGKDETGAMVWAREHNEEQHS